MSFPETAPYIKNLDPEKPGGGDPISYGDDHIRLIKKAVHDSFPEVEGPVTATHEELSHVAGVTSPIQDQIDDGMQQISVNDTDISNLEGRMDSAETRLDAAETRLDGHDTEIAEVRSLEIGDHPDVEFEGAPEDGDVMVFDGGKWRAKRPQSGNVMRLDIVQPMVCGEFGKSSYFHWESSYQNPASNNMGSKTFTFTNPQPGDLKFMLRNIKLFTFNSPKFIGEDLTIDGVAPFAGWGDAANVKLFARPANEWGGYDFHAKVFPVPVDAYEPDFKPDENAPLIEVKNSIEIPISEIPGQQSADGRVTVTVEGWFVEDK